MKVKMYGTNIETLLGNPEDEPPDSFTSRKAKLMLRADLLSIINWWVDGSFAVHPDRRGHNRGIMSLLGKGVIIGGSCKHKINGRRSTDNEIISVDDFLGRILHTLYFMRAHGYEISQNILFQDNQSTMRLLINGKHSSGKCTKWIDQSANTFFSTRLPFRRERF